MPRKTIEEITAEEIEQLYDGEKYPQPEAQDEGEDLIKLEDEEV